MDRQLSLGQYLIITVIVLLINNLALWYFLGSESEEMTNAQTDSIQTPSLIKESKELENIGINQNRNRNNELLAANSDEADQDQDQDQEQEIFEESIEVTSAVKSYMASDEFFEVLDTYRTQRQEKQRELQEEVAPLSTLELLNAYSSATDRQEKSIILQALYQSDLTAIDSYQLKEFYNDEDVNGWMKSKLLVAMLDQKDQEAINLAKDYVATPRRANTSYEIWNRLFDLDRDYVISTASEMSIEQLVKQGGLLGSMLQDSDAKKQFYENQLDNILNSNNSRVFQNLQPYQVEIELSRSQQNKLGDLMRSELQSERRFAIGFISNIGDLDVLKEGYQALTSSDDRQLFLIGAMANSENEPVSAWAQETIEASDNPRIQGLKGNQ